MRLGLTAGYSGAKLSVNIDLILEAERLGFDSVWTAEAYGSDAVSPLAYIAARTSKIRLGTAIMQMPARSPAMTAMTAMSLDGLSGGRFILGLGPSGPQVVEGWHGVAYGKPLTRTREYVSIVRQILRREAPLEHKGEHYQIPYAGPSTIRSPTRARAPRVSASRSRASCTAGRTSRSTPPRSGRRAWPAAARWPTA
jgi:alkanesulfonate monooxygenase SsuD/methylene tetrahydromethanopterin reductase-like flavin-dependent oxidoreductase (luciferase family)